MHRLPQHSLEPLPSDPATKQTPALPWGYPGHHPLAACRAWTSLSHSSKALGDISALGGTSAPGTGAALCRLLRAQGWRKPRKPSPVLPSALFPASLCGNSSNRSLDGGEVGWIFSPLFLEGFYSLDPPCYKLRNLFVISSLNLFLSSHLIIPLLTAFFDSPSPWGQPDRDVPMPNEDTCNSEAQTDPAGWDPLVPRCPLTVAPSLQQQCHGLTSMPIPRGMLNQPWDPSLLEDEMDPRVQVDP